MGLLLDVTPMLTILTGGVPGRSSFDMVQCWKHSHLSGGEQEGGSDLTLINDKMVDKVGGWHISDSPSLSDHAFLRFDVALWLEGGRFLRIQKAVDWGLYRQEFSRLLPNVNMEIGSKADLNWLS